MVIICLSFKRCLLVKKWYNLTHSIHVQRINRHKLSSVTSIRGRRIDSAQYYSQRYCIHWRHCLAGSTIRKWELCAFRILLHRQWAPYMAVRWPARRWRSVTVELWSHIWRHWLWVLSRNLFFDRGTSHGFNGSTKRTFWSFIETFFRWRYFKYKDFPELNF